MYYESGKRKNVLAWVIVLIIIVGLLNSPPINRINLIYKVRVISGNIFFPLKFIGAGTYHRLKSTLKALVTLRGAQKENEKLLSELGELKAKSIVLEGLERENKILRNMVAFRSRYYLSQLLPAELIGRSSSNWFEVIEINKGSADRVSIDTAVINEEGLVGRVFEVSQFTSKVLLITDPSSAVSIVDSETGDMAIATGNSMGPISIKYMPANANIKVGDKVLTSGMSDIFPRGIFVGHVRSVSKRDYDIFQKVEVTPAVNFSRLDKVFVVVK